MIILFLINYVQLVLIKKSKISENYDKKCFMCMLLCIECDSSRHILLVLRIDISCGNINVFIYFF